LIHLIFFVRYDSIDGLQR